MVRLRKIAPWIVALLSVIILVETTDLVGCPDQVRSVFASDTSASILPNAGPSHLFGADSDSGTSSDETSRDGRAVPDCLCQMTFVSTAVPPSVGAPVEVSIDFAVSFNSSTGVVVLVPGPIPLT